MRNVDYDLAVNNGIRAKLGMQPNDIPTGLDALLMCHVEREQIRQAGIDAYLDMYEEGVVSIHELGLNLYSLLREAD
jgi:hypothetical protein